MRLGRFDATAIASMSLALPGGRLDPLLGDTARPAVVSCAWRRARRDSSWRYVACEAVGAARCGFARRPRACKRFPFKELIVWTQALLLNGDLAKAEPKGCVTG